MADRSTPEKRREIIRKRLEDGSLPSGFPRTLSLPGDVEPTMMFGTGSGQPCSACGETISTQEIKISYRYPSGQSYGVHEECAGLWRDQLNRPRSKRS